MMKKILIFTLSLILVFSITGAVLAQVEDPDPTPCEEGEVTGEVVDFNTETNTFTVETETGLCTVVFNQDYGHPITTLLGNYFGSFSTAGFSEALDAVQVCVQRDETTSVWSLYPLAEGEVCPGTVAKVLGQNEDDSFLLYLGEEDGEISLMIEDQDTVDSLTAALEQLMVTWSVNEDGTVSDAGDDIAGYHAAGYGFGVIVKLYGIAMASQEDCEANVPTAPPEEGTPTEGEVTPEEEPPCGVDVTTLFLALQEGTSMGQLFKEYGKPDLLGVGHVRKNSTSGEVAGDGSPGASASGICNARANGGKANAKGHGNVSCGEDEPAGDEAAPQTENNNNNKNKNKDKQKKNNGKPHQ